jgi:ankyrin repeat protein
MYPESKDLRAVPARGESDYVGMSHRMAEQSDHIRAAIARHDCDCWEGYLELIQFRLRGRDRRGGHATEQVVAVVVDPLIRAAVMADALECLRPLHALGCVLSDVSRTGEDYRPVLMDDALESGADRVLAWLLDERICKVDAPGAYGWTPLHLAAKGGRSSSISLLLARGAFTESATQRGQTPLHLAVEYGHVAAVEQLLLAGANPGATTISGDTALMIAAEEGWAWPCVEMLLDHGSPVPSALPEILRCWGVEKLTQPRLAGVRLDRCRREEIGSLFSGIDPDDARLLLRRGADPASAAEHALRHRKHKLLSIIREYGSFPYTEAHLRAAADSALGMSQLLEDGADPNAWVGRGEESRERVPIIYYAATEVDTDLDVIPLLLEHGADSNAPDGSRLRPLICELINRGRLSKPLLIALIERGEGVNARDVGGCSALHALFEGFCSAQLGELLQALIQRGADPNARDHHGRTPMMIAVANTYPGALFRVQALLDGGADASLQDADGMSALHHFFGSHADVRGKYADEVGDEARTFAQRTCVRRIRLRRNWTSVHALPQSVPVPQLRC